MIIEFYGLPGSGKTYTAKQLETSHGFIRIRLNNRPKVIFLFAVFVLSNPTLSLELFFLYWRKIAGIQNWWNFIIYRYAKLQQAILLSKKGRKVILDEGPVQNIISFAGLFSAGEIRSLVNKNKSEAYVIFDVSEEVRNSRFDARGYGQRDQYDQEKKIKWVKEASEANMLFTASVRENRNFLVINENSNTVEAILNFVNRYED